MKKLSLCLCLHLLSFGTVLTLFAISERLPDKPATAASPENNQHIRGRTRALPLPHIQDAINKAAETRFEKQGQEWVSTGPTRRNTNTYIPRVIAREAHPHSETLSTSGLAKLESSRDHGTLTNFVPSIGNTRNHGEDIHALTQRERFKEGKGGFAFVRGGENVPVATKVKDLSPIESITSSRVGSPGTVANPEFGSTNLGTKADYAGDKRGSSAVLYTQDTARPLKVYPEISNGDSYKPGEELSSRSQWIAEAGATTNTHPSKSRDSDSWKTIKRPKSKTQGIFGYERRSTSGDVSSSSRLFKPGISDSKLYSQASQRSSHSRIDTNGNPSMAATRGSNTIGNSRGTSSQLGNELKTVQLLAMFSLEFDREMLEPFISYYKDILRIPSSNFHLFLQYDPRSKMSKYRECKRLLQEHGITAIPYPYKFSSPSRLKFYHKLLDKLGPNQWILPADADEFHWYPPLDETLGGQYSNNVLNGHLKLEQVLRNMERGGYTHLETKWEDRIGSGQNLLNVLPESNVTTLFARFPCHMPRDGLTGNDKKIALYRSHLRPTTGGTHDVAYEGKKHLQLGRRIRKYPKRGVTFHFKWRAIVKEKLQERISIYKKLGLEVWRQSEVGLKKLSAFLKGNQCLPPPHRII